MIFLGFSKFSFQAQLETVPKRFPTGWAPEAWESRLCRFRSVERPPTRMVLTGAEYWWLGRVGKKFPVTKKKHLEMVINTPCNGRETPYLYN